MLRWAQSGRDLKAFEVKLQEVAELLENAELNLSGLSRSWAGLILASFISVNSSWGISLVKGFPTLETF